MADRLSPIVSSRLMHTRAGGSTLTNGVSISDRRGNRRRSVGGFRPVISSSGGLK